MNRKLKITTKLISLGLLATLIYKLTEVPGGMILSGLFLGGMVIVLILVGGLFLTWLTKLISKRVPFWTIYFTITAIAFAFFHYQLYSPTLKIVVPENYTGKVSLLNHPALKVQGFTKRTESPYFSHSSIKSELSLLFFLL